MSPKILIVDDEPGIVTVVKNYFEMTGYQVLTAGNGTDAMKQLTKTPDLVLLDINMPDIDGLTVCRKIREHITCPILFLTARIEISDKVQGFLAGADDYIVKPFDLDELGARVAAHLRREHRKQEQSILRFFGDMVIDYSKREILIAKKPILLSKKNLILWNYFPPMQGRYLTGSGYTKESGVWTAAETATPLWNISVKYEVNLRL